MGMECAEVGCFNFKNGFVGKENTSLVEFE